MFLGTVTFCRLGISSEVLATFGSFVGVGIPLNIGLGYSMRSGCLYEAGSFPAYLVWMPVSP